MCSAILAVMLSFGAVGIYAYGRSQPAELRVAVQATLDAPVGEVWALLADPGRRPEWRPFVDRIGQIDADEEGHEVWRELDSSGDRFDFAIVERAPAQRPGEPSRLVIEVASADQIGMSGRWQWQLEPLPGAPGTRDHSVVVLTEETAIENPLWRGLNRITRDPFERVETELGLLAEHLQSPVDIERL